MRSIFDEIQADLAGAGVGPVLDSPLDPLSLAGAATLLALDGLIAGFLPVRRAANTEPLVALRSE